MAKEAMTSMGSYAGASATAWRKSRLGPGACTAVVEVVNLPDEFVSNNPHFVVSDTSWLLW